MNQRTANRRRNRANRRNRYLKRIMDALASDPPSPKTVVHGFTYHYYDEVAAWGDEWWTPNSAPSAGVRIPEVWFRDGAAIVTGTWGRSCSPSPTSRPTTASTTRTKILGTYK